jgi:hypothetical protein
MKQFLSVFLLSALLGVGTARAQMLDWPLVACAEVIVAATTATATEGAAQSVDDEDLIMLAQRHLKLASIWLIEEGVLTYRKSGKKGIHRKLIDEWRVQIWTDPWIESERYIDGFWIKARGIYHDVINLHRETLPSGFYEFWVVKVSGKDWSGVGNSASFYVTRTDDIYGRRQILEESETFIPIFSVDAQTTISFPTNDPKILYELEAWLYPEHFCNTDIRNFRTEIQTDGTIALIRRELPCSN